MTLLEVVYSYGRPPGEAEMRALKDVREVYGVWRIAFDEANHLLTVEYDASRLSRDDVTALLRNAGMDLVQKIPLVPPIQPIAA
jgi:hypothetical protein